jgi:hypothetical protein
VFKKRLREDEAVHGCMLNMGLFRKDPSRPYKILPFIGKNPLNILMLKDFVLGAADGAFPE